VYLPASSVPCEQQAKFDGSVLRAFVSICSTIEHHLSGPPCWLRHTHLKDPWLAATSTKHPVLAYTDIGDKQWVSTDGIRSFVVVANFERKIVDVSQDIAPPAVPE